MAYGADDGMAAWLASQGLTLPVGAPAPAVLREIGSSYVDAAYGHRLTCSSKTGGVAQGMAWPRKNHTLNGEVVPQDYIPTAWVNAAYRAGYLSAVTPGWATTGADASRLTKREKVEGAVEREFFSQAETAGAASAPGMPSDSIINGLVLPWLCSNVRSAASLLRVV